MWRRLFTTDVQEALRENGLTAQQTVSKDTPPATHFLQLCPTSRSFHQIMNPLMGQSMEEGAALRTPSLLDYGLSSLGPRVQHKPFEEYFVKLHPPG